MKLRLIFLLSGILLAGGVFWASMSRVSAQTTPAQTIIQRIAAKFGLKEADVQSVFDVQRDERQAEMQKRFEDNLTQAVKDGKITQAQKNAILAKHQQMQQEREKERTDWQLWLKANNLENVDLGFGFGGKGMGMGRGMGRGIHGW
jgi:hypothetical protein